MARRCRAKIEATNGFKTVICFDGTETSLWEEIAKQLVNCPYPNTVVITRGKKQMAELEAFETKWGTDFKEIQNTLEAKWSKYPMKFLTYVDVEENAYWYEKIIPHNMGDFTVDVGRSYGRIGAEKGSTDAEKVSKWPFPSYMFWPHYYSLINGGYDDATDDMLDEDDPFAGILNNDEGKKTGVIENEDEAVIGLRDEMYRFSQQTVSETIDVEFQTSTKLPFTRRQTGAAKKNIEALKNENDIKAFNKIMAKQVALVPRRVDARKGETLDKYFAREFKDPQKQADEFNRIIDFETDLLRAMEAVLDMLSPAKADADENGEKPKKRSGLFGETVIELGTPEEQEMILSRIGNEGGVTWDKETGLLTTNIYGRKNILRPTVFRMQSDPRDAAFMGRCTERNITKTRELYHGFKTGAGLSLVSCGGPTTEYSRASGMYSRGPATYTAENFVKSFGYLSFSTCIWNRGEAQNVGYMGIFEVATGKEWNPPCCGQYTAETLAEHDADCIHAMAGNSGLKMGEFVTFSDDCLRPRWLLRLELVA